MTKALEVPSHLRMIEWSCACGEKHTCPPGIGPGIVCRCGRRYERPTFDLETLCNRIDALEREVKELREWKARVTESTR